MKQPLIGLRWAWAGFWLVIIGTVMAATPIALGRASVLYTFYPPMIGSPFYYLGVVLVVVGSWVWVALMAINLRAWKKNNAGKAVPLAMFGNVAGAYLWAWTSVGAAIEILFLILPVALGFKDTIDAGLARVFFSWTLHAIVYFWLMPDLHRVLHDRAARHRRAAVQRHDGTRRLRALPRVLDADRHPPPVRRSAGGGRVQVPACGVHRDGGGAHLPDGVHHRRVGRDRGAPARRQGHLRMGQGACPGAIR